MEHYTEFLPISRADMEARGWDQLDFVVVGGDAYVDHPSFGTRNLWDIWESKICIPSISRSLFRVWALMIK